MTEPSYKSALKKLVVGALMLSVFVVLSSFSIWLAWMYFFRGPIPIETRGYVSNTLKQEAVQPSDIERYTLQHFHNLDDVVLRGIEYPSTCVACHGDYPHNKSPKVRAFFNAHSWMISCEVCHRDNGNQKAVKYKWLDSDTDIALHKLPSEPGKYGARIVPYILDNRSEQRLDNLISRDELSAYNQSKDSMDENQQKAAIKNMHGSLNKKPVSCDQCHTANSLLNFRDLLYSDHVARNLESLDVGLMIKGYEVFYLPEVLDR